MIKIKSEMGRTEVWIDGNNIGNKICGMRLRFAPDMIPTMELEVPIVDGLDIEMDNAIINVIRPKDLDSKENDTQGEN